MLVTSKGVVADVSAVHNLLDTSRGEEPDGYLGQDFDIWPFVGTTTCHCMRVKSYQNGSHDEQD